MHRTSRIQILSVALSTFAFLASVSLVLRAQSSEQAQVNLPLPPRAEPPRSTQSAQELEERGDMLKAEKDYFDALDFYRAAIVKARKSAPLYNKAGICELQTQRYRDAGKDFERAIHADHAFADAYNNLGVVEYESKKYSKALSLYEKAIKAQPDSASFYSNQGAAYFAKKEYDKASESYVKAIQIDPDIFERTSHNGVAAQLPSPEDRARYDYAIARLYARMGVSDRSLQYLRRAMEEGYKGINDVYKDEEFTALRKDPRFTELMAVRPVAIPE